MIRRRAYTLIEVLVTIAIITLLVGILAPSLRSARATAKRAVCGSNLRQIGIALRGYIGDNRDRLPHASFMPSVAPLPLDREEPISIADVLSKRLGNDTGPFQCPKDETGSTRPAPNNGLSYFESEGSSYEYRTFFAGQTMTEIANRYGQRGRSVAETAIWVMRDYDNFHAPAGTTGARRYLYIDGHVSDYEN